MYIRSYSIVSSLACVQHETEGVKGRSTAGPCAGLAIDLPCAEPPHDNQPRFTGSEGPEGVIRRKEVVPNDIPSV